MTRPRDRIDDALDGLTRRDLEGLVERARRRLLECVVCGEPGDPVHVRRGSTSASMILCPACFERFRLPEGRHEKKVGH